MLHSSILFFLSVSSLLQPLSAFESSPQGVNLLQASTKPFLNEDENCISAYRASNKRLLIFDNDGVLKPKDDEEAVPNAKEVLTHLSKKSENTVVVLSARGLHVLEKQYGKIPKLLLAGRLGAQRSKEMEEYFPLTTNFPDHDDLTKSLMRSVQEDDPSLPVDSFHQSANSLLLKYKPQTANRVKAVMKSQLEKEDFKDFEYAETDEHVTLTHKDGHKGKVVELILQSREFQVEDFCGFTFGDEAPDEKMHQVINKHAHGSKFSVLVNSNGNLYTHATHRLNSQANVVPFLQKLA